jgi:hypothetical protein
MSIEAPTLILAADEFKKVFPKGRILDIQPEEVLAYDTGMIVYHKFPKQPNRKTNNEPEGELIHVDFKLKMRIT